MEPILLIPSPPADFHFDSTSTSPYATAPSSPKSLFPKFFHHQYSPITPNSAGDPQSTSNVINNQNLEESDMDFAFDFSGQLEPPSISDADELFDGGKIKPSEPPPPPPPSSSTLVPVKFETVNIESFSEAFRRTPNVQTLNPPLRGHKSSSRSLSPVRVSNKVSMSSPFGFTWYNKWNLKNLLLFRSTSEGSAATITKGDVRNSSFRSNDGGESVGGSSRRIKRKVSAHEMHYTANRAVAEEMRRKTSLPYKSGLLGCLGFSHLRDVSRRR